jgi:hypothetical protein
MFVWEDIQSTGVNVINIERSGMLPAGEYELCVTVRSFQNDAVLTNVQPSGCTPTFTIALPQPPVTTTPACEETISTAQGQPILFSWVPMAGTPQRVQYRLRIVEIIGNRSANDALQSATTPPIFDKTISGNSYQVNPLQLATPNRPGPIKFAWSVTAIDPSNKTIFSNNGESEACSFEYDKGSAGISNEGRPPMIEGEIWWFTVGNARSPTEYMGDDGIVRVPIRIEIGRRNKGCTGFGICKIHINAPGSGAVPDSRLEPPRRKVYVSVLSRDEGSLLMASLSSNWKHLAIMISEKDLMKYQPDKMAYFKGMKTVTFEEDWTVPMDLMTYLGAKKPIIVKAGACPLSYSKGFYIILASLKTDATGVPPIFADIPGTTDVSKKDTIPCKELEEKIKAAEEELKKLKDELASLDGDGKYLDGKIKAEKASAEICNTVLKGLKATSDAWKKSVDACEKQMKAEKPLTASTKDRCAKTQKSYDDALEAAEAQKTKCDKLAESIKALEARRAALIDLIRTGQGAKDGVKEALEKCKKEAEEKKKKADGGGTTAGAGEGEDPTGGGEDPGHPGTGAGRAGKPCDPEGLEVISGPFKKWDPCRVEGDIELTACGVTRLNSEILEYMKKIYEKVKPLASAKEMAEKIAKAGSLHKAVCVNIHIVRDWKMVTYHWKCIEGKWVLMRVTVGLTGTDDYGWFDLKDKNTGVCCWIFAKGEEADSVDLKDKIQDKLDECR